MAVTCSTNNEKFLRQLAGAVRRCVNRCGVLLFLFVLQPVLAQTEPIEHTIEVDGHPMALWEKSVPEPKGHILLHHGRTWSSLPDFDLQVPGEELSLMDGFNTLGYSVWALDARGYGKTPRDNTGWNTPDRAALDLAACAGLAACEKRRSKPCLGVVLRLNGGATDCTEASRGNSLGHSVWLPHRSRCCGTRDVFSIRSPRKANYQGSGRIRFHCAGVYIAAGNRYLRQCCDESRSDQGRLESVASMECARWRAASVADSTASGRIRPASGYRCPCAILRQDCQSQQAMDCSGRGRSCRLARDPTGKANKIHYRFYRMASPLAVSDFITAP